MFTLYKIKYGTAKLESLLTLYPLLTSTPLDRVCKTLIRDYCSLIYQINPGFTPVNLNVTDDIEDINEYIFFKDFIMGLQVIIDNKNIDPLTLRSMITRIDKGYLTDEFVYYLLVEVLISNFRRLLDNYKILIELVNKIFCQPITASFSCYLNYICINLIKLGLHDFSTIVENTHFGTKLDFYNAYVNKPNGMHCMLQLLKNERSYRLWSTHPLLFIQYTEDLLNRFMNASDASYFDPYIKNSHKVFYLRDCAKYMLTEQGISIDKLLELANSTCKKALFGDKDILRFLLLSSENDLERNKKYLFELYKDFNKEVWYNYHLAVCLMRTNNVKTATLIIKHVYNSIVANKIDYDLTSADDKPTSLVYFGGIPQIMVSEKYLYEKMPLYSNTYLMTDKQLKLTIMLHLIHLSKCGQQYEYALSIINQIKEASLVSLVQYVVPGSSEIDDALKSNIKNLIFSINSSRARVLNTSGTTYIDLLEASCLAYSEKLPQAVDILISYVNNTDCCHLPEIFEVLYCHVRFLFQNIGKVEDKLIDSIKSLVKVLNDTIDANNLKSCFYNSIEWIIKLSLQCGINKTEVLSLALKMCQGARKQSYFDIITNESISTVYDTEYTVVTEIDLLKQFIENKPINYKELVYYFNLKKDSALSWLFLSDVFIRHELYDIARQW